MKRGESGIAAHLEVTVEINEEIKQKMIEYLQSFEAGIKKAGEFTAEQAPLVVQEFLAWSFWSDFAMAIVLSGLLAVGLRIVSGWWPRLDEYDRIPIGMISVFGTLILTAGVLVSAFGAAKVAIAPRIVVLEKISELVK